MEAHCAGAYPPGLELAAGLAADGAGGRGTGAARRSHLHAGHGPRSDLAGGGALRRRYLQARRSAAASAWRWARRIRRKPRSFRWRYLAGEGLKPGADFEVVPFDELVGKHGDHIGGERDAARALVRGDADAACMIDSQPPGLHPRGHASPPAARASWRARPRTITAISPSWTMRRRTWWSDSAS